MANPINFKQTNMLLTNEEYFFYLKLDLYFNDLHLHDFSLNFSFWISTVNRSRKSGTITAIYP